MSTASFNRTFTVTCPKAVRMLLDAYWAVKRSSERVATYA